MKQRYELQKTPQNKKKEQPDIQAELKERQKRSRQEATQRATEQAAREKAQLEAVTQEEDMNARIEALLSRNPDDFVIRFLQTEGQ